MPDWKRKQPAMKQTHPHTGPCHLFRIAPELRDIIYSEVSPTPDSLTAGDAITSDIGLRWIGQVLFNFEDIETMLDKLSSISKTILSDIRHLRVRGEKLLVLLPGSDFIGLTQALRFLSGLRLHTLTVLQVFESSITYKVISELVDHGQGWKQLRVTSKTSRLLGYNDEHWRKPQPADWIRRIEHRDAAQIHPSVIIYRS
ncbi:hypothetical protein GGR57DRAFT_499961 [Xylariaceae sp. FL1272]|nr:hypothetical protein GGR57DRAFT_499961 [Xylariaceae sp. FL1272]